MENPLLPTAQKSLTRLDLLTFLYNYLKQEMEGSDNDLSKVFLDTINTKIVIRRNPLQFFADYWATVKNDKIIIDSFGLDKFQAAIDLADPNAFQRVLDWINAADQGQLVDVTEEFALGFQKIPAIFPEP